MFHFPIKDLCLLPYIYREYIYTTVPVQSQKLKAELIAPFLFKLTIGRRL